MKFLLAFMFVLISNLVFAQNQNHAKPNSATNSAASTEINKSNKDKKVYYVDKRTKSKNNPKQNRTAVKQKPPISKAEHQNKSSSK